MKNSIASKFLCFVLAIALAALVIGVSNSYQITNLPPGGYGIQSGSLIPSANNTYDVGVSSLRWRDGWFMRNLTVSGNVTAANGTISFGAISGTSATITGNVSAANATLSGQVSAALGVFTAISGFKTGTANITAGNGSVVVTHTLGSIPLRIYLTIAGNPGLVTSVYWNSANSANFTIYATANFTNNTAINYVILASDY